MKRLTLLLCLTGFCVGASAASPRYISDSFEVTLRTGQSGTHQILRMLPSGTRVELIEVDPESGYSLVKTPDDIEGWVITRFLMENPGAREQLNRTHEEIKKLKAEKSQLSVQALESIKVKEGAVGEQKRLAEMNSKLNLELMEIKRAAADAIAIDKERKQLQAATIRMKRELESIRMENVSLKDRTARDWFMVGAGVLLFGIITGLIFSRMRFRKRSEWDSI